MTDRLSEADWKAALFDLLPVLKGERDKCIAATAKALGVADAVVFRRRRAERRSLLHVPLAGWQLVILRAWIMQRRVFSEATLAHRVLDVVNGLVPGFGQAVMDACKRLRFELHEDVLIVQMAAVARSADVLTASERLSVLHAAISEVAVVSAVAIEDAFGGRLSAQQAESDIRQASQKEIEQARPYVGPASDVVIDLAEKLFRLNSSASLRRFTVDDSKVRDEWLLMMLACNELVMTMVHATTSLGRAVAPCYRERLEERVDERVVAGYALACVEYTLASFTANAVREALPMAIGRVLARRCGRAQDAEFKAAAAEEASYYCEALTLMFAGASEGP